MHPVNIGIGGYHNAVVAEVVHVVLNVQRRLQQVEFFVLVNYFLGQAVGVEGFPLQEKTAWVFTSRDLVMEPLAESPSVINRVDSSARGSLVL